MFREVLKQQRRVIATFSNLEAAGEALYLKKLIYEKGDRGTADRHS